MGDFCLDGDVVYVIAAWPGPRRSVFPEYEADRTWYIARHLAQLAAVPGERIARVMIALAVPDISEGGIPGGFQKWWDGVGEETGGIPLTKFARPNRGLSYGGYSAAVNYYKDKISSIAGKWFIFIEDDYCFLKPGFDRILKEIYVEKPNCGMVFGMIGGGVKNLHGGVGIGITTGEVLQEVMDENGGVLPHANLGFSYDTQSQVGFTRAFKARGRMLYDVRDRYCVGFLDCPGQVRILHDSKLPILMGPSVYKFLEEPEVEKTRWPCQICEERDL